METIATTTMEQKQGLTIRDGSNNGAPLAVFKNAGNLASVRLDPITYPHYRATLEKRRVEWLAGQIYSLAGLMRIKDYSAGDALAAAAYLDGQIMSHHIISDYTFIEIAEAFKMGVFGELGEWQGLTVKSLWGFLLKSLNSPVRQEAINSIYEQKQARAAQAEAERIRAEIEREKREGTFVPTGRIPAIGQRISGSAITEDKEHQELVRKQAREILSRTRADSIITPVNNSNDITW